jgi:hypothetical protein
VVKVLTTKLKHLAVPIRGTKKEMACGMPHGIIATKNDVMRLICRNVPYSSRSIYRVNIGPTAKRSADDIALLIKRRPA